MKLDKSPPASSCNCKSNCKWCKKLLKLVQSGTTNNQSAAEDPRKKARGRQRTLSVSKRKGKWSIIPWSTFIERFAGKNAGKWEKKRGKQERYHQHFLKSEKIQKTSNRFHALIRDGKSIYWSIDISSYVYRPMYIERSISIYREKYSKTSL